MYRVNAKMTEEYMKTFNNFKLVSAGKSLDILESRIKRIIRQRNTNKRNKKEE